MGKDRHAGGKRDGSGFVALPKVVLTSSGYRAASHTSRSLLVDIASQYTGTNNGRLVACDKALKPLGWKSHDTITRAVRDLVDCGLLFETRKGMRPNKAAWYALTFQSLDAAAGYDVSSKSFPRGAYLKFKNAALTPSDGVNNDEIAPPHGVGAALSTPPHGAIRPTAAGPATPSHGEYLDLPSMETMTCGVGGKGTSCGQGSNRMPSRP